MQLLMHHHFINENCRSCIALVRKLITSFVYFEQEVPSNERVRILCAHTLSASRVRASLVHFPRVADPAPGPELREFSRYFCVYLL